MNLSALIIARNEEKKIELTLKSLSFVDEIVVILDRSIDDTKKIASKYTTSCQGVINLESSFLKMLIGIWIWKNIILI